MSSVKCHVWGWNDAKFQILLVWLTFDSSLSQIFLLTSSAAGTGQIIFIQEESRRQEKFLCSSSLISSRKRFGDEDHIIIWEKETPKHLNNKNNKKCVYRPMMSHCQTGGRSLDNSCSLCVKTCAWPQHTRSVSRHARGSYGFLTQNRMRLRINACSLGCQLSFVHICIWFWHPKWHPW